ncbi:hypothetical protein BH23GEM9_BH23GEM9_33340 [soil metagenome]
MGLHHHWTTWMREQPPVWPRRDEEKESTRQQRWQLDPELFEDRGSFELYPGATVLEDLPSAPDEAGMLRVLARYTAVRLLALTLGGLPKQRLRTERRIALGHIALLPIQEWERHLLERLARECTHEPQRSLIGAALTAGECAAKRDHCMGAFALYRAAYEIALARDWKYEAARAAACIAQLAVLEEAPVSARIWGWRARVLDRRFFIQSEAEQMAKARARAEVEERARAEAEEEWARAEAEEEWARAEAEAAEWDRAQAEEE